MARGMSLHIGLNKVDPAHYGGWSGPLQACEADARDMETIAQAEGFTPTVLLTADASRAAMLNALRSAASTLTSGDSFFLSYSGHGGQLPDRNGDEPDAVDETWCLYDGEIVDDELHRAYGAFAKGVRITVLSDSCHSGTVTKMAYYRGLGEKRTVGGASDEKVYRFMPDEVALRTYQLNRAMYDKILNDSGLKESAKEVQASMLLISGCQDNQLSADGAFNGLFTAMLLRVWNGGTFRGTHRQFHTAIVRRMPPDQTPNLFRTGQTSVGFERQRPFTV